MRALLGFCQFCSDARPVRRITKPTGQTFNLQDHRARAAVRQALKNVAYASSARPRGSAGPIRAEPLYLSFGSRQLVCMPREGRGSPVSNFRQTPRRQRLSLIIGDVFPYGRGVHHVYPPIYAGPGSPADSWTLFCPECSHKMRLIMAAPTHHGRETRTYECAYGHRERITAALP
jgi:hypothetical protein